MKPIYILLYIGITWDGCGNVSKFLALFQFIWTIGNIDVQQISSIRILISYISSFRNVLHFSDILSLSLSLTVSHSTLSKYYLVTQTVYIVQFIWMKYLSLCAYRISSCVDIWINKSRLNRKRKWMTSKSGQGGERKAEWQRKKAQNIPLRFIAICFLFTLTSNKTMIVEFCSILRQIVSCFFLLFVSTVCFSSFSIGMNSIRSRCWYFFLFYYHYYWYFNP